MAVVEQKVFDISGLIHPYFAIRTEGEKLPAKQQLSYLIQRSNGKRKVFPFPPKSQGVFYYHQPPDEPEDRAEIRFRLCADVARFAKGTDMELPNGTPWSMPLLNLHRSAAAATQGLLQLSIKEQLLDPSAQFFNVRPLMTLRPEKLSTVHQEIFDLSGHTRPNFRVPKGDYNSIRGNKSECYHHLDLSYNHAQVYKYAKEANVVDAVFPPDTKGVFYYHLEDGQPAISGEVRFRKCSDSVSFNDGKDLVADVGKPWCMQLWDIATSDRYMGLRHLLLQEGLVDEALISDIQQVIKPTCKNFARRLYTIDQPFAVDFQQGIYSIQLATRHGSELSKFQSLFVHPGTQRAGPDRPIVRPYTGRAMVRFELSTLPEHAELGPTLVLRFLELLTQIQCTIPDYDNAVVAPQVGSLYTVRRRRKGYVTWFYPLNQRCYGPVIRSFIELSKTS
ncbi:hypothetical protein BDZ97DRAFT_1832024 [Flammula alnicola]|nr:hypothetical protein BDZ97DRAFT_1832024 [Flammula alnicola]